ncbi:hypothetical protein MTR67_014549, partial [Solanum verrucosum]
HRGFGFCLIKLKSFYSRVYLLHFESIPRKYEPRLLVFYGKFWVLCFKPGIIFNNTKWVS